MVNVYTEAFGLDFLHFGDGWVKGAISYVLALPKLELGGKLSIGRDCWRLTAQRTHELNPQAACLTADVALGVDTESPINSFAQAKYYGLNLRNMITALVPNEFTVDGTRVNLRAWLLENVPGPVLDSGFPRLTENGLLRPNPDFSFVANPLGTVTQSGTVLPGGVYFNGTLDLFGRRVGQAAVRYNQIVVLGVSVPLRVALQGSLEPLQLPGMSLQRSADDAARGPMLDVDLDLLALRFQGGLAGYLAVPPLGLAVSAIGNFTTTQLHFKLSAQLFGIAQADLTLGANYDLLQGAHSTGLRAKGRFQTSFLSKMQSLVQQALLAAKFGAEQMKALAQAGVDAAKRAYENAQQEADDLWADIVARGDCQVSECGTRAPAVTVSVNTRTFRPATCRSDQQALLYFGSGAAYHCYDQCLGGTSTIDIGQGNMVPTPGNTRCYTKCSELGCTNLELLCLCDGIQPKRLHDRTGSVRLATLGCSRDDYELVGPVCLRRCSAYGNYETSVLSGTAVCISQCPSGYSSVDALGCVKMVADFCCSCTCPAFCCNQGR